MEGYNLRAPHVNIDATVQEIDSRVMSCDQVDKCKIENESHEVDHCFLERETITGLGCHKTQTLRASTHLAAIFGGHIRHVVPASLVGADGRSRGASSDANQRLQGRTI